VKFWTLPQFERDYKKLSAGEKSQFKEMLKEFIPSCDAYAKDPGGFQWPARLRFERLTRSNALAVTWAFSGPDGRATFQFETKDAELYVVWRRVGRHDIYREP
jgi:hypothetical protein